MPEENTKFFYAVVVKESVYTPGDERSRTNPGHGYPAETKHFDVFKRFATRAEFERWVGFAVKNKTAFEAVKVTPLEVTTETKINFGY